MATRLPTGRQPEYEDKARFVVYLEASEHARIARFVRDRAMTVSGFLCKLALAAIEKQGG